jgi:non-ribosomal peptide synthetase component F
MGTTLQGNFSDSAQRRPAATAVVDPGLGAVRYDTLDALSDRMRDWLVSVGVGRGDRVGLFMRKSVDTVAALLGALKAGAAYVPVDSGAPAARGAYILHNCEVKALVVEADLLPRLQTELSALGAAPRLLAVARGEAPGADLAAALDAAGPLPVSDTVASHPEDMAKIR